MAYEAGISRNLTIKDFEAEEASALCPCFSKCCIFLSFWFFLVLHARNYSKVKHFIRNVYVACSRMKGICKNRLSFCEKARSLYPWYYVGKFLTKPYP